MHVFLGQVRLYTSAAQPAAATWCSTPRSGGGGGDSGGLAFLTRARQHCGTLSIVAICTIFLCVLCNETVGCWNCVAPVTDEWVWIVWWNDNETGKSKYSYKGKKTCLTATLSSTYPTWAGWESNQGLRGERLAIKHPSHCTANRLSHTNQLTKLKNHIYQYGHARGTQWRSWLRYRAISRKVAGLIPNDLILLAALWLWVRLSL
jgi:hypothetical protein